MLRSNDLINKVTLLRAPLTLHPPIRQYIPELLNPHLLVILPRLPGGFDGEANAAYLGVRRLQTLADFRGGKAEGKRLRDGLFYWRYVVAYFLLL